MLFWSMFGGVDDALQKSGISALRTITHPTASVEERTSQINQQIIKHFGKDQSVHLIGHSMGGLDARYLASPAGLNQGHRICTITTLSTPHRGSVLAEKIPVWFRTMVSSFSWILKTVLPPGESKEFYSQISENRWDAFHQLTKGYLVKDFNLRIIDHPNVHYFSYASVVNPANQTLVGKFRKQIAKTIMAHEGFNDGMVGIESAKWGECRGTILANHGEIVGLKVIPWQPSCFDHISFLLEVVKTLPDYE